MTTEIARLEWFEAEELAIHLCCLSEDADAEAIETALFDKFGIEFDQFQSLVAHLIPLCMIAESPITRRTYRGFASGETWLAKQVIAAPTPEQEG
jgi:hypothetical protein